MSPTQTDLAAAKWLLMLLLAVAVSTAAGGCATQVIPATQLPPEFIAPPVENVQMVDLSRLVTYTRSNELIDAGDVLHVTLATDYSEQGPIEIPVRVAEDGSADIPQVGRVRVAGLELDEAEQAIAAVSIEREVYRNPHVTVTMERRRMNVVTVVGAVKEPGVYELPRGASNLLAAIVEAGGLDEDAGVEVEVRRPQHRVVPGSGQLTRRGPHPGQMVNYEESSFSLRPGESRRINLAQAAREGHGGYDLADGDVVMVMKRQPQPVHVIGLVRDPKQIELPANHEVRVLDAMAQAGGRTMELADKVRVIRRVPGQSEPVVIGVSVREAKLHGQGNLVLAPGDIVSVEETPATAFVDALTRFARFGLSSSIPLF